MKDARFSLNSKAIFRPTQNGTVVATSIQTVDQLQREQQIDKKWSQGTTYLGGSNFYCNFRKDAFMVSMLRQTSLPKDKSEEQ